MAAHIGTHPRVLGALLEHDEMKAHLRNARDFVEKYAKDGGCVVEFGCNGGRRGSVGGASCLLAIAVELGYSVTLVHYSSEHWSHMRCGGACRECQDVAAGLDLCKRRGWVQMAALPLAAPAERHTTSRRGPPPPPPPSEEPDREAPKPSTSKVIPRAARYSRGSQSERSHDTERSMRTRDSTDERGDEPAPSTIQGRPAEDDRD